MNDPVPFPQDLKEFISSVKWTYAKTYAETWPREYIVRERVDEGLFLKLVHHIRTYGYEGKFYKKPITYFDEDGLVYWTMGEPVDVTTVINRCRKDQSYEFKLLNGLLQTSEPRQNPIYENDNAVD